MLEPIDVEVDAPETLARFRELVEGGLDARRDRARAEGGRRRPQVGAARAHRPRARAGAAGRDRCAAAGRAAAPRSAQARGDASLQHVAARPRRPAGARRRAGAHVLLRPDRLPARAHRQRAAVRARHVAAQLAAAPRLRRDARPQHHGRQRQDLRRCSRRERRARRARDASGTSRTPATSGSACPTGCRRRPSTSRAIVRFIEQLLERGATRTRSRATSTSASRRDPGYGRLSGQRPDQMEQGEEPSALKEDPRDFALWKANKPGEDTAWDAPWGRGRPGWHIECSAMAEEAFGPVFEIHGGGLDLVFPHHENELAQSNALGHEFARIWTHNGMLEFGGEKMSKSLGNDVSLRNVLDTWGREVVLLFFMTGHWRKPIDFTDETLQQAKAQVGRRSGTSSRARLAERADEELERADRGARRRLQHARRAGALPRLAPARTATRAAAGRSRSSGSARSPRSRARRPRSSRWRSSGCRRGQRKDFAESDRLRDEIAAAGWDVRDEAGRLPARAALDDARAGLRPPPGARGAPRPARGARALGDRARRRRPSPGCARSEQPRVQVKLDKDIGEAAGSRDHQGVARLVRAVQVRRRVRARRGRAAAARLPRPGERSRGTSAR